MKREDYKKAIQRRAGIRSEVDELQGTLAKENRAMTDEEKQHMTALRAEDDNLTLQCTQYELDLRNKQFRANEQLSTAVSSNRSLAEILRSMSAGKGIPEEYAFLRSQGSNHRMEIPDSLESLNLRADGTIQTTASAEPVIPISIREIIKALEPETVIGKLGLHIQNGIQGQWNYPTIGGGTADWAGENDTVDATSVTLGKITPTPHRLPVRVDISNLAIWQSAGSIREIIITRMSELVANRLNTTMFNITAGSNTNSPTGPFVNVPSANKIAATGALSTVKRKNLIDLRTAVNGTANVPVMSPAYIINWATYAQLADTSIDSGSGRFILDITTNTIDGVPVIATNYCPAGYILYGNFGYEMLGQFNAMTMTVDGQSAAVAERNVTEIVINSEWDMLAAHNEAFGYITYTV
jgi:HK97 family phage major capsid protein